MRYGQASFAVVAVLVASTSSGFGQSAPTPQRSVATPANPSVRLPTLELVGEYGCADCLTPSFGTGAPIQALAAGAGSSFAALVRDAPQVRIWNLDSNTSTSFVVTQPGAGQVSRPAGIMLAGDTVVVAGNTFPSQRVEAFGLGGNHVRSIPIAAPANPVALTGYVSSPSGKWLILRQTEPRVGYPITRVNRATGESEILDIPTSLVGGTSLSNPLVLANSTSVAVADDGTVAMGSGKAEYRLLLIPVDASPRIQGGRSIPMRLLSAEQVATIPPTDPNRARPPGVPHFGKDALSFDAKGRLWVKTTRGNFDTPTRSVFDVFDPKLGYLGEVAVEGAVGDLYHIGPQLLVARMWDRKDTSLKVWRIREP